MVYENKKCKHEIWSLPRDIFATIVKEYTSYQTLKDYLYNKYDINISYKTLRSRINVENIDTTNLDTFNCVNRWNSMTKEELENIIKTSNSQKEVMRKLGYKSNSNEMLKLKIKEFGIDRTLLKNIKSKPSIKNLDDILANKVEYESRALKKRLVAEGILEYKCILCGNIGEHNGKPLTLQLDHINGNHHDNTLDNLRILCPNCHTQTENYGSKNRAYRNADENDGYVDKLKTITKEEYDKKKDESVQKCKNCDTLITKGCARCIECANKLFRKAAAFKGRD